VDPPTAAGPLAECLRNVVVDRGREAMPALEALPLRLPKDVADQAELQTEAATGTGRPEPANGAAPGSAPKRKPSPRPRRSR
jgi:uncharacterized protein DUF3710